MTAYFERKEEKDVQQSAGKDTARDILYREWLPSVLTPVQIRSAAVLLLLGEEPREIPYLDTLGVSRQRIYSVENNHHRYNLQSNWELEIHYVYKDMSAFLEQNLHKEQCFAFMNLDIEGTFRYNIDPSLTEALLYCFRYPKTAMATYTTIGHDDHMLHEGMYSLVFLLWLAPRETENCIATLQERYAQAGYEHAFSMVLRDLFWIRSHIEHACLATFNQNKQSFTLTSLHTLFVTQDFLWTLVKETIRMPMRFGSIKMALDELNQRLQVRESVREGVLPRIGIRMAYFRHLIYRGQHTWSQKCYFTMFEKAMDSPISLCAWAREVLTLFTHTELTAIDQKGQRKECGIQQSTLSRRAIVWSKKTLYTTFKPRKISEKFYTPLPEFAMVSKGKLTEYGIFWVQGLAEEGLSVAEMRTNLGKEIDGISDAVLRGYISAARKKQP